MTKELRERASSRKTQNSKTKMKLSIGFNNVDINILDSVLKRLENPSEMAAKNRVATVLRKAGNRKIDKKLNKIRQKLFFIFFVIVYTCK